MKVAVIGYGSIGKRHVQNLLSFSNHKIIICTKQKKIISPSKKITFINSISSCIKEKPDIALITNDSSLHLQTAITFAHAGIDLFIEKPLSNSIKGTKELSKIISEKKLITQMGCQLRFHKCIRKIKKLILEKRIGKIISVKAECGSFLPEWHPYEDYSKGYAARNDLGGGVILTCIHEIDYLYWFFGDVSEIFSFTEKVSNLKITADDLSSSLIKFKNGIICELHLDFFQKPSFRSCKVIGTKGVIYWDSDSNIVKLYDFSKNKWLKMLNLSNFERNSMYKEELSHFITCVKKRKITINPAHTDGIKTLEIALAINKSSKTKKMIKL